MNAAAATPVNDHDHASAVSSGSISGARRAEYSGNNKKTMPVIVSETASAAADPRTIPKSTVKGFTV